MVKVTADNFAEEVEKILDEYAKKVDLTQKEVAESVAKKGVNLLRRTSKAIVEKPRSKYPGGWAPDYRKGRVGFSVTIYNKAAPGLPHLLEKSHPVFGDKFYKGRPHIKPVEDLVIKTYEQELIVKL